LAGFEQRLGETFHLQGELDGKLEQLADIEADLAGAEGSVNDDRSAQLQFEYRDCGLVGPLAAPRPSLPFSARCRSSYSCRSSLANALASCIRATVNGQVRACYVGRFRASDECDHRGDLFDVTIPIERRVGCLGRRPITCGRVQIRVDRARLNIVDRDAPTPNLS
jgi:hypothetical protein